MELTPTGAVRIQPNVLNNGVETGLSPIVTVPGVTHTADTYLRLRAQVVGSGPTTIRMKVWVDGTPEPANWATTTPWSDSAATLQSAGAVGLRAYLSSAATNAPVTVSFDDYEVKPVAP